jgi:hypothetical protein
MGLSSLKNLNNKLIFLPPNHLPRKILWCKNQENQSDRISHTWAPFSDKNAGSQQLQSLLFFMPNLQVYISCYLSPSCRYRGYFLLPLSLMFILRILSTLCSTSFMSNLVSCDLFSLLHAGNS